jgi:5-methylcytosine-specific restriction protein A
MSSLSEDNYGQKIAQELSKRLDLNFEPILVEVSGGTFTGFRFSELPRLNGVSFLITNTPSRIQVEAQLESYAGELLSDMSVAEENDFYVWESIQEEANHGNFDVLLEINGHYVTSPRDLEKSSWMDFSLEVRQRISRNCDPFQRWEKTLQIAEICASLVMSLLPLEAVDLKDGFSGSEEIIEALGEVEGEKTIRKINSYERSKKNRNACITIYGWSCFVCSINFRTMYGERGMGYIEVHHREPVSLMKEPRALSPKRDLIPVCSNCHRMLHRTWPPATPEQLKEVIIDASKPEAGHVK